jgi:phosphomannomutase / phosphoglucomutase
VGRDARTHSPELEAAVITGLLSTGCEVLTIGQTPSPLNYFTICTGNYDGGVQVTASHNPKDDNGLKLQIREAEAHSGEDLQKLRQQIEAQDFVTGTGKITPLPNAIPNYITKLSAMFNGAGKNMKVVVDAGNGVAGPVYCQALRATGAEVVELFTEPDGTFPNHPADPSKHATLKDLQKTVVESKAHLGFAFDGDGDRLGLVDEQGAIHSSDDVLLLLAEDHLGRTKSGNVVFTVSNSESLNTEITRLGGKPHMCKVGHSFVEHAMREHQALLGGEQSGHFFCGENYYGFDDAIVAALRILSIAGRNTTQPFSTLFTHFPKVYQAHERRPHCSDDAKASVIQKLTADFATKYPVNTLDGARIDFGDGAWAGLRYSNTSPCLSICIEARSPAKLANVEAEVLAALKKYPEIEMDAAH